MKTIVIHHSADYDGIFCREVARKFLPDSDLIGWDFGDPPITWDRLKYNRVFVLDLPCDAPVGAKFPDDVIKTLDAKHRYYGTDSLTWIDHHKSAIESHPKEIAGYRIDGVAACRLAWQWFTNDLAHNVMSDPAYLPRKEEYIARNVSEPLAVRLAGEYDIWDHRGDGDLEFQFGLRSIELKKEDWDLLLGDNGLDHVIRLTTRGSVAMAYSERIDASLMKSRAFTIPWEGRTFLCLNSGRFNSQTFSVMDKPETGHDALLGFSWTGKEWMVSLYHAAHRKDLDLSTIAVKYGGGGHRGACGFRCRRLPFIDP